MTCFEIESAGNKLASHIILDKLPYLFLKELKFITSESYPDLNLIFEHYDEVLRVIEQSREKSKTSYHKYSYENKKNKPESKFSKRIEHNYNNTDKNSENSSLKTFDTRKDFQCKLCNDYNHYLGECLKYLSFKARRERCIELKLCSSCSNGKHLAPNCPARNLGLSKGCYHCKSKKHISALCSADGKSKIETEKSSDKNNSDAST